MKIPAHKEAIVGVFREYEEEVIKPRNVLAHARGEKEGRRVVFKSAGLVFDFEKMKELRGKLIKHDDNLSDLHAELLLIKAESEAAVAEKPSTIPVATSVPEPKKGST